MADVEFEALERQLDELRSEIELIKGAIKIKNDTEDTDAFIAAVENSDTDLRQDIRDFIKYAADNEAGGCVSCRGLYKSEEKEYYWETGLSSENKLLDIDNSKSTVIFSALASKERFAILKEIIKRPTSVNELIDNLGFSTTGQVYHHIKVLQNAGFIFQSERGYYEFCESRMGALMMLLCGIQDMLADKDSKTVLEINDSNYLREGEK